MTLYDVEKASLELREKLKKLISVKLKILLVAEFLSDLLKFENIIPLISYLKEFEPILSDLVRKRKFDFFTPQEIENLIQIISKFKEIDFFKKKNDEFNELQGILENELNRINNILNTDNLTSEKINLLKTSTDSINLVLIEIDDNQNHSLQSGIIQKLKLRTNVFLDKNNDPIIEFNNYYDHNDKRLVTHLKETVELAHKEYCKEKKLCNSYNYYFSFDETDFIYTGTSLGIAASVLAYNSILINELNDTYYKFYDDVVFTGEVDLEGNLVKLDDDILRAKLRTVFFSTYNKFVVPEDNLFTAKDELSKLQKLYPNRKLDIIPVKNFQNIFKNLNIVEVKRLKLVEKAKAKYKKHHKVINISLSLLLIIIIAILFINYYIPYFDKNPAYAEVKDNRYFVYNKYGIMVWQSESLIMGEKELLQDLLPIKPKIFVTDLDDDGENEILCIKNIEKDNIEYRALFCYNSDNELKWLWSVPARENKYGNDIVSPNPFPFFFTILNNSENKKEIFISYKISPIYPFYTAKINFDGKYLSDFYNPGFFNFIITEDIDNDGKTEIIQGGVNNDLDHRPVVVSFDPKFIEGSAPGYRIPNGYGKGLFKNYMILPKSPLNKFTINNHAEAYGLYIQENGFIVLTEELLPDYYNFSDSLKSEFLSIFLIYHFDKNFNIIDITTSSQYDKVYDYLRRNKMIKQEIKWDSVKVELMKQIKWWDGDKFVDHPVINKYYLEAVKK